MPIELGKVYRDKITGFQGVAISKTEFLYACERIGLQPQDLKDQKPLDPSYFDIYQLEPVAEKKDVDFSPKALITVEKKTGGPGPVTPRHTIPSRG